MKLTVEIVRKFLVAVNNPKIQLKHTLIPLMAKKYLGFLRGISGGINATIANHLVFKLLKLKQQKQLLTKYNLNENTIDKIITAIKTDPTEAIHKYQFLRPFVDNIKQNLANNFAVQLENLKRLKLLDEYGINDEELDAIIADIKNGNAAEHRQIILQYWEEEPTLENINQFIDIQKCTGIEVEEVKLEQQTLVLRTGLDISEESEKDGKSAYKISYNLGLQTYLEGKYDQSLMYLHCALKNLEEDGENDFNLVETATTHQSIANIYRATDERSKVVIHLQKALAAVEKVKVKNSSHYKSIKYYSDELYSIWDKNRDLDPQSEYRYQCLLTCTDAQAYLKQLGIYDYTDMTDNYIALGGICSDRGQFQAAFGHFKSAVQLFSEQEKLSEKDAQLCDNLATNLIDLCERYLKDDKTMSLAVEVSQTITEFLTKTGRISSINQQCLQLVSNLIKILSLFSDAKYLAEHRETYKYAIIASQNLTAVLNSLVLENDQDRYDVAYVFYCIGSHLREKNPPLAIEYYIAAGVKFSEIQNKTLEDHFKTQELSAILLIYCESKSVEIQLDNYIHALVNLSAYMAALKKEELILSLEDKERLFSYYEKVCSLYQKLEDVQNQIAYAKEAIQILMTEDDEPHKVTFKYSNLEKFWNILGDVYLVSDPVNASKAYDQAYQASKKWGPENQHYLAKKAQAIGQLEEKRMPQTRVLKDVSNVLPAKTQPSNNNIFGKSQQDADIEQSSPRFVM